MFAHFGGIILRILPNSVEKNAVVMVNEPRPVSEAVSIDFDL